MTLQLVFSSPLSHSRGSPDEILFEPNAGQSAGPTVDISLPISAAVLVSTAAREHLSRIFELRSLAVYLEAA